MTNANKTTMHDDAGSYFLYENKEAAQADCAKFNYTVEDFHATVQESLDNIDQACTYLVAIWYGRSGTDYACSFGPYWRSDV